MSEERSVMRRCVNCGMFPFPMNPDDHPEAQTREWWRYEFARAALQGMLANAEFTGDVAEYAKWSVEHADALLAALEKGGVR